MYCIFRSSQTKGGDEVKQNKIIKKYATYYMELGNIEKLADNEEETGIKKSVVVNQALKEYFARRGVKN
jgi:hypothetical protein